MKPLNVGQLVEELLKYDLDKPVEMELNEVQKTTYAGILAVEERRDMPGVPGCIALVYDPAYEMR